MALVSSIVFWCRFGASVRLSCVDAGADRLEVSPSSFVAPLASEGAIKGLATGHVKPVRGVYSGRYIRRVSKDA